MTPRTPVPPSDLHWQAPDRHQRALPPCGLRNDASLVAHLYYKESLPLMTVHFSDGLLDGGGREP